MIVALVFLVWLFSSTFAANYNVLHFSGELFKTKINVGFFGDSTVGKSTFAYRLLHGDNNDDARIHDINSTTGIHSRTFYRDYGRNQDGDTISASFVIFDTAGQEEYRATTSQYYRMGHIYFILFDMTAPMTWIHAQTWLMNIIEANGHENLSCKVIKLVANKADLLFNAGNMEEIENIRRNMILFQRMIEASYNGLSIDIHFTSALVHQPDDWMSPRAILDDAALRVLQTRTQGIANGTWSTPDNTVSLVSTSGSKKCCFL